MASFYVMQDWEPWSKPGYVVIMTHGKYPRENFSGYWPTDRDEELLDCLSKKDLKFWQDRFYSYKYKGTCFYFSCNKKFVADRLEKNMRKALKKCHVRGRVMVFPFKMDASETWDKY